MSIDRGDRIIVMMVRSLCCCGRSSQVADGSSEEIIGKQQLKNVFIVCTQNVLTRALTGKLMAALEDRHLLPVHMKLLRPTQDVIDKSHLLKEEKRRQLDDVWMILVFRGREAQTRVAECIKQFKTQYSLHKNDIYWTDTEQQAKHEEALWFKNDELVSNGEMAAVVEVPVPEQNGNSVTELSVASLKIEGEHGIQSEVNSVVSTEGPHLSVNSSQIPTPTPPEDDHPTPHPHGGVHVDKEGITAEVISNTADILEPVEMSPAPTAPVIPLINQPTQIE
ncbi:hypothetical protein CRE_19284 [Caenorhabditis remanei]|uniref:Uncharacterized protein n=1 Tax=Caenorhabditis remanei TaxID=31234 RepID=E3MX55_CAERE|nr:hypothetical protein CRE_19284 [Caenorhabditis remanei]